MANIDQITDGLEAYIRERVRAENPDIETRPRTAIHQTNIKPNRAILEPLVDDIRETIDTRSLIDLDVLTDEDVDLFIANLLLTRRTGSKSAGSVRVFFAEPRTDSFLQGMAFISKGGTRFEVPVTLTFDEFTMRANVEGGLFFIDVNVVAETEALVGNVAADDIVDVEGGPDGIVQVTNKTKFVDGADRETNVQARDRTKKAITVRNLTSKNAISTVILEAFPSVRSVGVVGFADDEMTRDLLIGKEMSLGGLTFGDSTGINIGGKTDIYVLGTSTTGKTVTILSVREINRLRAKDGDDPAGALKNVLFVTGASLPVVELIKIEELDPATGDPSGVVWVEGTDFVFESENSALTFSVRERVQIRLLVLTHVGKDIKVSYDTAGIVQNVQDFIGDAEGALVSSGRRITCADQLVRHVLPAKVDATFFVRMESGSTKTATDLKDAVESFIGALDVGVELEMSDFVSLLYDNEARFVRLTPLVVVTVIDENEKKTVTTVTDVFSPSRNVGYLVGTVSVTFLT